MGGAQQLGLFFGDDGFFRIKMGENQLGIESQCTYPVVSAANLGASYCHGTLGV